MSATETVLNRSCESCRLKKVKCSKDQPVCKRCQRSGDDCVYRKRKKRLSKGTQSLLYKSYIQRCSEERQCWNMLQTCFSTPSQSDWLGRAELGWAAAHFLTSAEALHTNVLGKDIIIHLYMLRNRHVHHSPLGKDNITQRLDRIILTNTGQSFDCHRAYLVPHLERHVQNPYSITTVDYLKFSQFSPQGSPIVTSFSGDLSLHASTRGIDNDRSPLLDTVGFEFEAIDCKTPCLRLKTDFPNQITSTAARFVVESNAAFQKIFGKSDLDILQQLQNSISGYLPYGISILSLLVASKTDFLSFIELQCAKMYTLGHPASFPWTYEFPTVCNMKLFVRDSACNLKMTAKDCRTLCVSRVLRDLSSTYEEIYVKVEPQEDLSYLWEDRDPKSHQTRMLHSTHVSQSALSKKYKENTLSSY